jgi:hypothetical protein
VATSRRGSRNRERSDRRIMLGEPNSDGRVTCNP